MTGAALAAVANLPAGAAANTGSGCDMPATSQVFSQFGDSGYYYLASGGAFEDSLTWRASGSPTLVNGGDIFDLHAQDKQSARISFGSSVQCPERQVLRLGRLAAPALRRQGGGGGRPAGQGGPLQHLHRPLLSSTTTTIPAGEHADWAPTRNVSLNTSGMAPGENALARVTLKSAGDWDANDVYIDPYAK